jgi:hypothetical protein
VILCDTGPLVAAFNEADSDHARCAEFLASNWSRLVIPSLAVTEVCHLLADPQRRGRVGLYGTLGYSELAGRRDQVCGYRLHVGLSPYTHQVYGALLVVDFIDASSPRFR